LLIELGHRILSQSTPLYLLRCWFCFHSQFPRPILRFLIALSPPSCICPKQFIRPPGPFLRIVLRFAPFRPDPFYSSVKTAFYSLMCAAPPRLICRSTADAIFNSPDDIQRLSHSPFPYPLPVTMLSLLICVWLNETSKVSVALFPSEGAEVVLSLVCVQLPSPPKKPEGRLTSDPQQEIFPICPSLSSLARMWQKPPLDIAFPFPPSKRTPQRSPPPRTVPVLTKSNWAVYRMLSGRHQRPSQGPLLIVFGERPFPFNQMIMGLHLRPRLSLSLFPPSRETPVGFPKFSFLVVFLHHNLPFLERRQTLAMALPSGLFWRRQNYLGASPHAGSRFFFLDFLLVALSLACGLPFACFVGDP